MTVTKPPTGNRKKVQGQYLSPDEQRMKRARRKVGQMTMAERDQLPAGSIELEAHLQLLEEAAHEKVKKEAEEKLAQKISGGYKYYLPKNINWGPLELTDDFTSYKLFQQAPPSAPKLPAVPMLPGKGNPIYLEMNGSKVFLGYADQIVGDYPPPFYADYHMASSPTPKLHPNYTIKLSGPQMESVLNLLGLHNTCGDPTCADHIVKIA